MKKYFLYLLGALATIACTNDEISELSSPEECKSLVVDSFYVPYETALKYALEAIDNGSTTMTRVASPERRVASHYEYVANKMTRSASDDVEARFHVINFEDNKGFALVSADSRTTPVYAYSETGNIDIDNAIENSGFGDFMEAAEEYYIMETSLGDSIGGQLLPKDPTLPITPVPTNPIQMLPIVELDGVNYYLGGSDVSCTNPGGVLLGVEWHQVWPYNYYCGLNPDQGRYEGERNSAGCGPIAAAQIMSYFKYPLSFGGYTFDWNGIVSSPYFLEVYPQISNSAKSAARLINLIGIEANAVYGRSTDVSIGDMYGMFRTFGYSCSTPSGHNPSNIKESLDNNSLVCFGGINNTRDGHLWVIDSYKQTQIINIYYHMQEPYDVYRTTVTYGNIYYHCNWGWVNNENTTFGASDNCNGWYLDVFRGFCNDKVMIYNIRPNI